MHERKTYFIRGPDSSALYNQANGLVNRVNSGEKPEILQIASEEYLQTACAIEAIIENVTNPQEARQRVDEVFNVGVYLNALFRLFSKK